MLTGQSTSQLEPRAHPSQLTGFVLNSSPFCKLFLYHPLVESFYFPFSCIYWHYQVSLLLTTHLLVIRTQRLQLLVQPASITLQFSF
jgi:hypothetical protein